MSGFNMKGMGNRPGYYQGGKAVCSGRFTVGKSQALEDKEGDPVWLRVKKGSGGGFSSESNWKQTLDCYINMLSTMCNYVLGFHSLI